MNELKQIRVQNNITQEQAAKMLNVSRRSYQMYESSSFVNNNKYDYLLTKMREKFYIDETHGILKIEDIKKIVQEVLDKYEVRSCYLFGSYAKGVATEKSDVDLFIDTNTTGLDYFGLIEELRESLKKKVDLLDILQVNNNTKLLSEILKDGIKIYG